MSALEHGPMTASDPYAVTEGRSTKHPRTAYGHNTTDSIRFRKDRIEETNAEATFTVGLLYGPSGCGKSSLVKAGLLPQLPGQIVLV